MGGKHHATWDQGRPKHKPSMLRHCVSCAELVVEALSKAGGGALHLPWCMKPLLHRPTPSATASSRVWQSP